MGNVKPIPEGHHTVTPSLVVKGGAKALEFYQKAFGAVVRGRMDGPDGTIMHAEMMIGNSLIFLGDEMPEMGAKSPKLLGGTPVTLNIYAEDCDKVYNTAVAAGATVTMPLADMFWGDRYGKVVDPFGHSWGIATHKEDVSEAEMGRRMKEEMEKMGQK